MNREQFKNKHSAVRCNDWLLLRGPHNSVVIHRDDVRCIELYDDERRPQGVVRDCVGVLYCGHGPTEGVPLYGNQANELLYFLDIHYMMEPDYITADTLFRPTMAEKLRTVAIKIGARFLKGERGNV